MNRKRKETKVTKGKWKKGKRKGGNIGKMKCKRENEREMRK